MLNCGGYRASYNFGTSDITEKFSVLVQSSFVLDYFKIPLSIAVLSIPASALVIANHRSQQTLASIDDPVSQNALANFLKHIEKSLLKC